jgi:acyl-CoA thioesterase 8
MPEVPPPEQCDDEEVRYARVIQDPSSNRDLVKLFQEGLSVGCLNDASHMYSNLCPPIPFFQESSRRPIAIKVAKAHYVSKDGIVRYMYWMKARNIPQYEGPFQKVSVSMKFTGNFVHSWAFQCILAYISDLHLYLSPALASALCADNVSICLAFLLLRALWA